jgi:hypothetical protein
LKSDGNSSARAWAMGGARLSARARLCMARCYGWLETCFQMGAITVSLASQNAH